MLENNLSRHSCQDHEIQAARLLKRAWDGHLPVCPDAIAKRIGVFVHPTKTLDVICAEYSQEDGVGAILLNALESPERQRFAVAHSLGHHLHHCTEEVDTPRSYQPHSPNREEAFANNFALALLVPSDRLRTLLDQDASVDVMCQTFGVTHENLKSRLESLAW